MAGRVLAARGQRPLLLDKSVSAGGRMATRRISEGRADHGAQFFTVREPAFAQLVERWLADGWIYEWARGWSDGSLTEVSDGHPRYAAHEGMNALAQRLVHGLPLRLNATAVSVQADEHGWVITDSMGAAYHGRAVLLTPPVPQSLAILDRLNVPLPPERRAELDALTYAPCVTAMIELEGDVSLPAPGAVQRPHANIYWIADNKRKGISAVPIWTAQASAEYSRVIYDLPDREIETKFRVDLQPFLPDAAAIRTMAIKKWRYSQPEQTYAERCLVIDDAGKAGVLAPLAFAGDAFGGPRVEGAVLSGLAAGEALAERLS
jgi:hypothetical protein